jgi:hypothetical protein
MTNPDTGTEIGPDPTPPAPPVMNAAFPFSEIREFIDAAHFVAAL